jgi:acetyl-CoA carboxylase biotin carboxyl carrier protein
VRPGGVLGELEILGRLVAVVAPDGARGVAVGVAGGGAARRAVEFGTPLVTVDPRGPAGDAATAAAPGAAAAAGDAASGRVYRAPMSGRFYGRPGPDKPPYVAAGGTLEAGATICMLEVMKTFNRVTYSGEPARVCAVLVADGDDVSAGDPLLALE